MHRIGFDLTPYQARLMAQLADGWSLTCMVQKWRKRKITWFLVCGYERQSVTAKTCRIMLKRELVVPRGDNYGFMGGMAQDFQCRESAIRGRAARLSGDGPSCPYDAATEPGEVIAWHTAYRLPIEAGHVQE